MPPFERKLSHSSMATYRRCLMRYKWGYLDDYDPLPSRGQMMGGIGHVALGEWYRSLGDGKSKKEALDLSLGAASARLAEYENQYGYEMNDLWDPFSVIIQRYADWALEQDDFKCYRNTIEHKFELKLGDFTLIGYIDGIVEKSNGSLWVLEHKFNKQVQTKHLELDPQVSIYMLAARATGFDVRGALYNVIRTTLTGIAEKEPVVRLPIYRNNEGLEKVIEELHLQMQQMRKFHEEGGINAFRNPTRDCSWDCGFYGACLAMNDDGNPMPFLRTLPMRQEEQVPLEGE